jgi:lysine 2,3-aminomutase
MPPACISLDELTTRFGLDPAPFARIAEQYPFRLTRYYAGLIKEPGDPIWRQCVPDPAELADDNQVPDPLDEERLSPVPGLIHRYPDRAVLLVSNRCAVYCRFCMRKRQVGCGAASLDLDRAIGYIAATPQLKDVVLSGGDPLLLPLDLLHNLLRRLRAIPHLEIILIGRGARVTAPSLVTPELCRMLAGHQPLYVNTHFNHPHELTAEAGRACALLADSGIPLGNQTVLLKGINDERQVLEKLFTGLLRLRVRPYYLHQMDLVRGTAHFRTPLQQGMKLATGLRGRVSGMAIPHFVVDLPGGQGKVPLLAETAQPTADGWLIRNPAGEQVIYRDPA